MLKAHPCRLVVLSAPSGTGKDTIAGRLLKMDDRLTLSCSATTRRRKPGETDGVDYYFLSREDFENRVRSGGFVEYTDYGGNLYGTLKSDISERIEKGKIVLLVIDVHGGESIRKMYPGALSVFLVPPSVAELERRLRCRCRDTDEEIAKRLLIAEEEMECAGDYDYTVVNDDLDKAVDEVYNLILQNCVNSE